MSKLPQLLKPFRELPEDLVRRVYIAACCKDPDAKHPDSLKTMNALIAGIRKYSPGATSPADVVAEGAAALFRSAEAERELIMATKKAAAAAAEPKKTARKAKAKVKELEAKLSGKKKPAGKKAASTGEKPKRSGVGATIRELLAKHGAGKSNAEIAEMAKGKHPDSNTNASCVAWYRNDMKKKA